MRNLTVRFDRTKLVERDNSDGGVYDVSDAGELIRAVDNPGFHKHGEDECFIELGAPHDVSGRCISLIENAAAFSCGAVVSWDWTAAFPEGAEVVGNVVRISTCFLLICFEMPSQFFCGSTQALQYRPFPQGGGLDTMVLSPDEELLLLVTPQPKAILMTREFDPIAEVDVDASQDDVNQVRTKVCRY